MPFPLIKAQKPTCSVLFGSSVLLAKKWTVGGGFAFCPVFSWLVVLLFVPPQQFQKVLSQNTFLYSFFFQVIKNMITYLKNSLKLRNFNGNFDISRCRSCSALCVCVFKFKRMSSYKHVLSEMDDVFRNLTHRNKYLRHLG